MANTYSANYADSAGAYHNISHASQTGLNVSGDFTVEFWMKIDELPSTAGQTFGIIGKWTSGTNDRAYQIYISNSDDKLRVNFDADGNAGNSTTINADVALDANDLNIWIHYAIAVDVSVPSAAFYRDGKLVTSTVSASGSTSIHNSGGEFRLGNSQGAGDFEGNLNNVRFWNDIRTAAEIRAFRGVEDVSGEGNIVSHWKLNNDATDSVGSNDLGAVNSPTFQTDVGFAYDTFWPDSSAETTTVDGHCGVNDGVACTNSYSWSGLRTASGTLASDSATTLSVVDIQSCSTTDAWRQIRRAIFTFDTSPIPDANEIATATLSVYGSAKADALSITPNVNVYSSTPASNTAVASGDYANTGSTTFSTAIAYSSFSTAAYNDFTLNSNGIANISKTGVSKFCLKNQNYDGDNSAPTWSSALESYINIHSAENGDISQSPKLVLTYSTGFTPKMTVY